MKKTSLYFILLIGFALITLSGCFYDNEEELYPNAATCDTTSITYSGTIRPFISTNCAKSTACHATNGQTPDLTTYAGVKNNIDRIQVRAIDEKTMPPSTEPPLSSCDITKLQLWINAGAPNN